MKKNEQINNEQQDLDKRKDEEGTIHLDHAPKPRGRNEMQIDSDVNDI